MTSVGSSLEKGKTGRPTSLTGPPLTGFEVLADASAVFVDRLTCAPLQGTAPDAPNMTSPQCFRQKQSLTWFDSALEVQLDSMLTG